ncbi:sensor histidine kinase [Salinibius halmophilus]|uniref:sensor histidine kinase n=1 Tax=Salinibius halmophilus TaxID=1853216 RepID=UPI000E664641|nr:ATP-binding protein [Salinibius halmophilus]
MRWTIKAKTIVGVAVIEITLLTLLIITGLNYFRSYSEQRLASETELVGSLFAQASKDAVISYDLATLESLISALEGKVHRLRVVNQSGLVLAQTANFDSRPFIVDESLAVNNDNEFAFEVPIVASGSEFGVAQIGIDVSAFERTMDVAARGAMAIAMAEILLVALFSFLLGSYLTRQLSSLRGAADKIKDGDFDVRIQRATNDEIGEVALAFNKMAENLSSARESTERYQHQLQEANRTLEARVADRTQLLEQANQSLQETANNLRKAQGVMARQETLASVGTLSAGMAHEINTPLGFIAANMKVMSEYIEELADNQHVAPDILQDMREIVSDNQQGLQRIKDIIKSLKAYVHDGAMVLKPLQLDQLVKRSLNLAKHRVRDNVYIIDNIVPDCWIEGDETRLIQVVTNLIVNASQAMPEGGPINLYVTRKDDRWCLHVQDSGTGIAPEHLEKLFEPFFTTKSVGEGTGLGLSISYGIIEEHNGELKVQSQIGQGSRFTVVLPIHQPY